MCKCVNITPQNEEAYAQMILVDPPEHMREYKKRKIANSGTGQICVDPCIFEEIKYLWSLGITTYGSCCGHNTHESMVNVHDKDIDLMLSLGYVQNHRDLERKNTFRLKSA